MHKNFADWYNAVSLRPDAQTLERRWEAVEALASQLKIAEVPSVIRVFFALSGSDHFLEEIRKVAKEKDTTFVIDGDRNELTVLAGGVIAQRVSQSSNLAGARCIGRLSCVGAQGLRQAPRLQGVVDETMRYLADESVRTRTIDKGPVADINTAALTKLIASKGGIPVSDVNSAWNGVEVTLKEFLSEHTKHTQSISLRVGQSVNPAARGVIFCGGY